MAKKRRKRKGGLGEVTKKDFVSIAAILKANVASCQLVKDFANYFRSQNSRFDHDRFVAATTLCKPPVRGRLAGLGEAKATCLHRLPTGRCVEWDVGGHKVKVR